MCVRTDAELRDTFDDLVKFDMVGCSGMLVFYRDERVVVAQASGCRLNWPVRTFDAVRCTDVMQCTDVY